jgi:thiamine-phosphate pyrophosphorylase
MPDYGLYVITADVADLGRSHLEIAEAALAAGVRTIQFRDKNMTTRELLETASALRQKTRSAGARLFVNDRVDVALAVEADGVHLGPDDMPVTAARRLAGSRLCIGASAGTVEEAIAAAEAGADYLGVGSVFATDTKPDAGDPIGLEGLRKIAAATRLPVIAIGGITRENAASVIDAGADGAAVIRAVVRAPDMTVAARDLLEVVRRARSRAESATRSPANDARGA